MREWLVTTVSNDQTEKRPAPRWKGGRPSLPAEERRCVALPPVRLRADELAAVTNVAESCGITLSELVRRRLLGQRLPWTCPGSVDS